MSSHAAQPLALSRWRRGHIHFSPAGTAPTGAEARPEWSVASDAEGGSGERREPFEKHRTADVVDEELGHDLADSERARPSRPSPDPASTESSKARSVGRGASSGRGLSTVMLYNCGLAIGTRMSGLYESIMSWAADSEYIDPEHVWPLGIGCTIVLVALVDVRVLNQVLASLDGFTQLRQLLVMALKGVVAGMITHFAYSTSDISFRSRQTLQSKERALLIIFGVGVGAGLLIDVVIPQLVEPFPFVVVQTTGLLLVVGMWYLHLLIENWKLSNEWPHVLSGLLIAFGPYVPYLL